MKRPIKNINSVKITKTVRHIPKDEATKDWIGSNDAYKVYAVVSTFGHEYHITRTVLIIDYDYSEKFNRERAKAAVYAVLSKIDPPSSTKTFEQYIEEIDNEFDYDSCGFIWI